MRFKRKNRPEPPKWLVAAGIVLVGAAAAYAVSRVLRSESRVHRRELAALHRRVIQALRDEAAAGLHSVDAAIVGLGVVELSGVVDTPADAQHLIHTIDNVPGVHAVLSRLEVREIENKLQKNRERPRSGEGARWYGGSVGMGRRRQSAATDPARPDDHAALIEHALQPNLNDTLTDVEERTGGRIGISHATGFATTVPPHSPEMRTDLPGPPSSVASKPKTD